MTHTSRSPVGGRTPAARRWKESRLRASLIALAVLVGAVVLPIVTPLASGHARPHVADCPGGPFDDPTLIEAPVLRCAGDYDEGEWYKLDADAGDVIRIYMEPQGQGDHVDGRSMCLYTEEGRKSGAEVTCSTGFWDEDSWNGSAMLEHHADEARTWYLDTRVLGYADGGEFLLSATLNKQSEAGSVLVGSEDRTLGDPPWNVDQRLGPASSERIDGDWVRLAETGTGEERVELAHEGGILFSTYIYATFYDEQGLELEAYHCDGLVNPITCTVPAGAAWVLVEMGPSVTPSYELRYLY